MEEHDEPSPQVHVTDKPTSVLPEIPAEFVYKNYKGEVEVRRVFPRGLWYGSTDWHPEKQWFIHAYDLERKGLRDFALKDIGQSTDQNSRGDE